MATPYVIPDLTTGWTLTSDPGGLILTDFAAIAGGHRLQVAAATSSVAEWQAALPAGFDPAKPFSLRVRFNLLNSAISTYTGLIFGVGTAATPGNARLHGFRFGSGTVAAYTDYTGYGTVATTYSSYPTVSRTSGWYTSKWYRSSSGLCGFNLDNYLLTSAGVQGASLGAYTGTFDADAIDRLIIRAYGSGIASGGSVDFALGYKIVQLDSWIPTP